ncbi:hypothetical protein [Streptomyces vietnamensis]|uniref:hypothetical protein n=1 Tax=Streptomyces vietnamensis TaxID=362257 RepID=UPI003420CC19
MATAAVRRARRWFWALTALAVLAAGLLHTGLSAATGPGASLLVLVGGLVLTASVTQAARILTVLAGPTRRPVRARVRRPREAGQP